MIGGLKCTHEELSGRQKLKTDGRVTLSTTMLVQNSVALRKATALLAFFYRDPAFLQKIKTDPNTRRGWTQDNPAYLLGNSSYLSTVINCKQ